MKKSDNDQKMELMQKQIDEWKNKYLRALADYQNLEKRIYAQKDEIRINASAGLIEKILPFIDTLDELEHQYDAEGFKLALKQIRDTLENEGIVKMEVTGKKFDPMYMECIEIDANNAGDDVVEELRPGYMINDRVVRIAKVKVGRAKENKEKQQVL